MLEGFVEELQWRGLIHDIMPETANELSKSSMTGYIGFDPTADSLHIGSLVQIMILMHFQRAGHKPIALVGGATGMIGDPSGKSAERNLLTHAALNHNIQSLKNQLAQFLDFESRASNAAELVNNYDWMQSFSLIDFIRDIGKHLTVNYMMAKDSVKKRLGSESKEGMSFTEFSYQLIQGYDFLHLYQHHNCKIQMGGSDQWGNITTGTELIRRKTGGKAYAITCPLITKSDGTKFGKTEGGNVWLDKSKTSPYKFYQYWLNASDDDAENYIKIFTFLSKEEIQELVLAHHKAPHLRTLQHKIANEITAMVHSQLEVDRAIQASQILFGKATSNELKSLDEQTFLEVFEGVPQQIIRRADLQAGIDSILFLSDQTGFLKSKGEARRALQENSISINKEKIHLEYRLSTQDLLCDRYVLIQRGKKNYFLVIIS